MTIWFVIRLHSFYLRVTSTIWAVIRLHVFLCVDEEELPESEEDFPDL